MYKNSNREKSKQSVLSSEKGLFCQGFWDSLILKHVKTLHSPVREPKRPQVTPTVNKRRREVFFFFLKAVEPEQLWLIT